MKDNKLTFHALTGADPQDNHDELRIRVPKNESLH